MLLSLWGITMIQGYILTMWDALCLELSENQQLKEVQSTSFLKRSHWRWSITVTYPSKVVQWPKTKIFNLANGVFPKWSRFFIEFQGIWQITEAWTRINLKTLTNTLIPVFSCCGGIISVSYTRGSRFEFSHPFNFLKKLNLGKSQLFPVFTSRSLFCNGDTESSRMTLH